MDKKKSHNLGGARPHSGKKKTDPAVWGQITCKLRKETIRQLREGSGGKMKHFGSFLQFHLDRHPLPDHQTYVELKALAQTSNGKPNPERERAVRLAKRAQRLREQEERAWKAATPKQRSMWKLLDKLTKEDAKKALAK